MSPWRILSLLLDYPEAELLDCTEELAAMTRELESAAAREAILAFLAHRAGQTASEAQREYVETFDFAKRATLYLSFHAYGDRRQRGMAMLHLKTAYREEGFALGDGALPDYLPAILEFAGEMPEAGVAVLGDFRPALEVVRAALRAEESAYAGLLDALCGLLPAVSGKDLEEARRIAAEGPPSESVGLEPFGPPEAMPPACAPVAPGAGKVAQ
ncbi:MAG: nitrate reductase molybdenum cofactor assembly chaperone [Actinobacteria bacterium]|nr:nitrate reductase molybdenum cofactor assembly chaperone [Actinomycetota bacterium]